MYPHERSLVSKMANKPFALLGVNSDRDREALKQVLVQEKITWRSFWNGGTGGPIARDWGVSGWPTLYLIDHKGVIRQKWLGSPRGAVLDQEIDKLVKEAEGTTASAGTPGGTPPRPPAGGQGKSGTQVGLTAQEIEGEDIDGKKFKLSDYRGKVVLLDFWGHW
jgi:hypothetical protein